MNHGPLKAVRADRWLSPADKAELCVRIPRFQAALDEFLAVCIAVFVEEKRFRIPTSVVDRKNTARGMQKIDVNVLVGDRGWRGSQGKLQDGRSIRKAFVELKRLAHEMLATLDEAVNRAWASVYDVHVANGGPHPDSIQNLVAGPDVIQPIPDPRFKTAAFSNQTGLHMADLTASVVSLFNRFVDAVEAGTFGIKFANKKWLKPTYMGTDLSLPESERDTGNLMWNITGVLRKPDSVGLKGSMVCLYFYMVRSRFADLGFLATIVNAIGIHYVGGDAAAKNAGVEVQNTKVKGHDRIVAKDREYLQEYKKTQLKEHGYNKKHLKGHYVPFATTKDYVRKSANAKTLAGAMAIYAAIVASDQLEVVQVKNRFGDPATRDCLMVVRLGDSEDCASFLAELQIHVDPVLAIKAFLTWA